MISFLLGSLVSVSGGAPSFEKAVDPIYDPIETASERFKKGGLEIVVFKKRAGRRHQVKIFDISSGISRLIYRESSIGAMRLASIHKDGLIPKFDGESAYLLAYHVDFKAMRQNFLVMLRYQGGRVERVSKPIPSADFEDILGNGKPLVVSRENPFGNLSFLKCGEFFVMGQTTVRPRIYAFNNGKLKIVSMDFPEYYSGVMAKLEGELSSMNPVKNGNFGEYFGAALSLYYCYEELGKGKEGWGRFKKFFRLPHAAPDKAKRCLAQMEIDLRKRLGIPPDWQ